MAHATETARRQQSKFNLVARGSQSLRLRQQFQDAPGHRLHVVLIDDTAVAIRHRDDIVGIFTGVLEHPGMGQHMQTVGTRGETAALVSDAIPAIAHFRLGRLRAEGCIDSLECLATLRQPSPLGERAADIERTGASGSRAQKRFVGIGSAMARPQRFDVVMQELVFEWQRSVEAGERESRDSGERNQRPSRRDCRDS